MLSFPNRQYYAQGGPFATSMRLILAYLVVLPLLRYDSTLKAKLDPTNLSPHQNTILTTRLEQDIHFQFILKADCDALKV